MTKISVTETSPLPLAHILDHLRPEDRAELEAVRGPKFDATVLALELCKLAVNIDGWLFWNEETKEPIAALGAYGMTPVVAGLWAFGTPDWRLAVQTVTKHARHIMVPKLLKLGYHRAECRALTSRRDTKRWLTGQGWKAEAVMSGFGIRRESFTLFAWVAPDNEPTDHPHRPERESELSLRGAG